MRRLIFLGISMALVVVCLGMAARPAQAAWGEPNGCGSGGWVNDLLGANPYNDQFRPACDLHDWCYGGASRPRSVGAVGDWLLRKRCDELFYQRMLATCKTDALCQFWADEYYEAVRAFGDASLFGKPYTTGQRDGQYNLLPNPFQNSCRGCAPGTASSTVHIEVRGSNTTYWKLDTGAWHRIACLAWDPNHIPCTATITVQIAAAPSHIIRVKAVDYYTGPLGHTWTIAKWASTLRGDS